MLPDHLAFLDHLARHIDVARASGTSLGLALLHIPCVGRVDSLLGYRKGDEIAQTAASHLTQALRPADRIYRVDRGTLACVLTGLANEGQAWAGAYKMLRTLGRQVEIDTHFIQAMPSVGLALFPTDATDADALLARASLALQAAPGARDRIGTYDAEHHLASQHELDLQSKLGDAVEENGLLLRFQPQLDLQTGAIVSSEALSRWTHPTLGVVPPDVFIRAAEMAGWMPRLTHWLLHTCLRQQQSLGNALSVAVNLSAQDLAEKDLPGLIAQALATWNVQPQNLVVEITETAMMENDASLADNLGQVRQMGIRLSIDDFGTGYSSLARLKILPVDEIKIDVSFVRDMLNNTQDQRIVRSIIDLAHNLGVAVVAEGVENRQTLEQLGAWGCDMAQGYFISPPLTIAEFDALLQAHRPTEWAVRA